jgi:hypothetical protein
VLEWNRCSYVKDPRTGKRVARPNPPELWKVKPVPELRIVDDELWQRVKERQLLVRAASNHAPSAAEAEAHGQHPTTNGLNAAHRSRFLLSGRMTCGCCGGGYTIIGKDRYGCATRRQKGTCDNARTITRQEIEARVLVGLKERLLAPDLVAEFIAAVQDEVERARTSRKAARSQHDKKLAAVERRIAGILTAIEDGLYDPGMKERLATLRAEKAELEANAAEPAEADLQVLMHPRLPDLYRRKVEALERVLDGPDWAEAMD